MSVARSPGGFATSFEELRADVSVSQPEINSPSPSAMNASTANTVPLLTFTFSGTSVLTCPPRACYRCLYPGPYFGPFLGQSLRSLYR